jgi:glycosyltransferase involved in cell wall biosynthesis
MHILFITDNFPPETNAPATRTYEHCREWVKAGATVTVITCAPNFPQGKVYSGYRNKLYQEETLDGIRVIRVWSYITANEGFTKRILDYLSFACSSFLAGLFQKADVIVATSPQFFTTWAGITISKIRRTPWIFELRDLWPESIRTVGAMQESRILDFFEKIELFLYRNSSAVVAVTDAFKRNLISRGIDPEKIHVITNGANLDLYQKMDKNPALLEKHGLAGKFVVGYIGTHGMAHSLEFIVNSLAKVVDKDIHFLFIGGGAKKADVVRLAREKGLDNATFLDPVPKDMVPEYMSITDVALVPLLKSDTFKTVIPSKIFEASAMGKPILLGVEGQAKEIVDGYHAGICFEPENELDFLDKLCRIRTDRELYKSLQEGCERLALDFDRKRLAEKMYGILQVTAYEKNNR